MICAAFGGVEVKMAIEVFNRYEEKYILTQAEYDAIIGEIESNMDKDAHNEGDRFYPISNIYYDTPDFHLIRTSLMRPKYKEKLRLRSYGKIGSEDMSFLEIKKKYRGLVNKRRTKLIRAEAEQFLKTGTPPEVRDYMNPQVLNELTYFVNHYKLCPAAFVGYDRLAFFGRDHSDLRISLDKNIRGRTYDLTLGNADGEPILEDGYYLMEIKTRFAKPLWLTHVLTRNNIRRAHFSKYGTYYTMLLEKRRIKIG